MRVKWSCVNRCQNKSLIVSNTNNYSTIIVICVSPLCPLLTNVHCQSTTTSTSPTSIRGVRSGYRNTEFTRSTPLLFIGQIENQENQEKQKQYYINEISILSSTCDFLYM